MNRYGHPPWVPPETHSQARRLTAKDIATNRFNPNPNATVCYGDQTWEEIHFPSYGVVIDDPSVDPRRVAQTAAPPARAGGD